MSAHLAITFPGQGPGSLPAAERLTPDPIVGTSDALKYVMYRVDQVAAMNTAVLLLGETGTGKELVARAIHQRSPRRNRNFVVVDCGALPSSLIERASCSGASEAPSPAR
jgi:transcriptional regulator with GAF, ATPase, and Fis domain